MSTSISVGHSRSRVRTLARAFSWVLLAAPLPVQEAPSERPLVPDSPLATELREALEIAFGDNLGKGVWGTEQLEALRRIGESEDPRLVWILSDFMRVSAKYVERSSLSEAATALLGIELDPGNPWRRTADHLMAWDIPAPPSYLTFKRRILTLVAPEWEALLIDGPPGRGPDWRDVTWGGVGIDLRPAGETDGPCNCIPAADDPKITSAGDATWLAADAVVFGVTCNGESRAYPRRVMEVREMVNDTLGGRALGIPYCTLCGSAQAFLTERPGGRIVLRTSGLLSRSNKVMFDLKTMSAFDTFRGIATTGPLAEEKVVLEQISVVTTSWSEWKRAHPNTTVLHESLALGKDYDLRNTRDAEGPIFPVGTVDPRFEAHREVLGVLNTSGIPIAFPAGPAKDALLRGETVAAQGIELILDGGGLRAVESPGSDELGSHLSFWFAWSQFHPRTTVWTP